VANVPGLAAEARLVATGLNVEVADVVASETMRMKLALLLSVSGTQTARRHLAATFGPTDSPLG
jgi:hypothetical protein